MSNHDNPPVQNIERRVPNVEQNINAEGRRSKGFRRAHRRFALGLLPLALCVLLSACAIEGGVPPRTPTELAPATRPPQATSLPTSPLAAATATTQPNDTLALGLLTTNQPRDLLPYHSDSADARNSEPITTLLFPPPLLALNYGYTTTGVLEQVPLLENGGAELRSVDVFLDAAGTITTTATDVVTKAQQIVVTYRWNPQLKWADGTPLTADDSVFAYELARQTPLGADAATRLGLTDRYVVVDAHTTQAFLKPDFLDPNYFLTFWTPLPRHLLKNVAPGALRASDWAARPLGYGPYTFEGADATTIRLTRNTFWAGNALPAEWVSVSFLESVDALRNGLLSGRLDVASADRVPPDQIPLLDQNAAQRLMQVSYVPGPVWEHLDYNLDVPLLQDIRVRRAIALAIDRVGLTGALFAGHTPVLDSWLLPGQWATAPADQLTRYDYDPDEARRLLDEVGLVDSNGDGQRELDGAPLTIELLTTEGAPLRSQIAEQLRKDLADVGVTLDIKAVKSQELYSPNGPLFQRQFELVLFAWIAGPDPAGLALWSCKAVPSQQNAFTGDNFPGWCFREADQAITVATTSLDQAERQQAYLRQQQLFTQELPSLPLFQRLGLALASPQISGVQPDALAPITWNLTTWERQP
ncbi:MAG: peptide ABC transporter substrate-binding protein [Chloroflexales bacterium]|nr:peptide ABC transporter substrate-binding protein [Chloroflexales bacterium]